MKFKEFIGKTFVNIIGGDKDNFIIFKEDNGNEFKMYHSQDCCESVSIDDICGELDDLLNSPIVQAEESTNSSDNKKDKWDDSFTWTFYRIATIKGSVLFRSNGMVLLTDIILRAWK